MMHTILKYLPYVLLFAVATMIVYGEELRVKAEDALLYKNNINEGDKVCFDKNNPDFVISHISEKCGNDNANIC